MPEGHTIHRLARDHNAAFGGHPVGLSSPQGRFADGAARLDGRRLLVVDAYGKHLFYGFAAGGAGPPPAGGAGERARPGPIEDWLHIHLGLYGGFVTGPQPAPSPRGALRLRLENPALYADLRGPTACELIVRAEKAAIQARLGPDPLRRGARPERAFARIARSRVPLGALLMDQSVVAGIGNVYRAELLFLHRLDPYRPGNAVTAEQWAAVWSDLRRRMALGVRSGRIVTTAPADRSRRSGPARREDAFYVYRRTDLPCRVCGTPVRTAVLAGRNLYWCPVCQTR